MGIFRSIGSNPSNKNWPAYKLPSMLFVRTFLRMPDSFVNRTIKDLMLGCKMITFLAQSVIKVQFSFRLTYSLQKLIPIKFLMKFAQRTIDIRNTSA